VFSSVLAPRIRKLVPPVGAACEVNGDSHAGQHEVEVGEVNVWEAAESDFDSAGDLGDFSALAPDVGSIDLFINATSDIDWVETVCDDPSWTLIVGIDAIDAFIKSDRGTAETYRHEGNANRALSLTLRTFSSAKCQCPGDEPDAVEMMAH